MPTPQWSPEEVLQIDPHHATCIGYAKTTRRRCRNAIADANGQEAAEILSEIARLKPQSGRVECELEYLASLLLCKRWHQDQALAMKELWMDRIEDHQVAKTVRRQLERPSTVQRAASPAAAPSTAALSRESTARRHRDTPSTTGPVIHTSISLTVSITINQVSGGRESNEPREESREPTGPEPDSSSRQAAAPRQSDTSSSPSSANPPIPSRATPQEVSTSTRVEEQDQDQGQETSEEAEPPQPTSEPSTQPQQPQHEPSHLTQHSRRPIEGDCSICCEDLGGGDDTTWCRAQCKQNFHADCINLWHVSEEVDARVKTCPYW